MFNRGDVVEIISGNYDVGKRGLVLSISGPLTAQMVDVSTRFIPHSYRRFPMENLQRAAKLSKQKGYSLEEDLNPILYGLRPLPNWEPIEDLGKAINAFASWGGAVALPDIVHVRLPVQQHSSWARVLLSREQHGGLSGEGLALVYSASGGLAGYFAICKHEKIAGGGANPNRGWHPGACSKCGLDMTVDSSD